MTANNHLKCEREEKPYVTLNSLLVPWSDQAHSWDIKTRNIPVQRNILVISLVVISLWVSGEVRLWFPLLTPAGTSRLSLAWPGAVSAGCTAEQAEECRTPGGCPLPLLTRSGSGLQTRITDFQRRGITCLVQYLWYYLFSLPLLSSHPLNGFTLPDSKYIAELCGPPGGFEMYCTPRLNSVHVEDVFFWRIWFSSFYRKCIFITFAL